MRLFSGWVAVCGTALVLAFSASVVVAAPTVYNVSLNTSALVGQGTFNLDLQFNDGSGTADGNNSLTLNSFLFGGGSASGAPTLAGGASGTVGTSVSLTDSAFFNEFLQAFIAGSSLSFQLTLNSNLIDAGPTPDLFTLAILDSSFVGLPTLGPLGEFISITLDGRPTIAVYGTAANSPYAIGAPSVTGVSGVAVPEPSALWLAVIGLAGLVAPRTRRALA